MLVRAYTESALSGGLPPMGLSSRPNLNPRKPPGDCPSANPNTGATILSLMSRSKSDFYLLGEQVEESGLSLSSRPVPKLRIRRPLVSGKRFSRSHREEVVEIVDRIDALSGEISHDAGISIAVHDAPIF